VNKRAWQIHQNHVLVDDAQESSIIGVVAYGDQVVEVGSDDVITFGRAPDATLQIGHDPIVDTLVARHAGSIGTAFGRLAVLNTNDQLAIDVCVPSRPPVAVSPGATFSPAESEYEIRVAGSLIYRIGVRATVDPTRPKASRPHLHVSLTPRQRQMLDVYVEPTLNGNDPATHQDVADRLNMSRSLVRFECGRIRAAMLRAGIPLRNFGDSRDLIVDAWIRHRM
jgi:hypothetical protein